MARPITSFAYKKDQAFRLLRRLLLSDGLYETADQILLIKDIVSYKIDDERRAQAAHSVDSQANGAE
jgi:hypothetical protein